MFNEEIVSLFINPFIKSKLDRYPPYQKSKYYGIAMLVSRETEGRLEYVAGVLDSTGEVFSVEPDDTNNFSVYHRLISTSITPPSEMEKDSFGDRIMMGARTNMKMIVWGRTDNLKRTQERVLGDVLASLPAIAGNTFISNYRGLQKVSISPSFANNDGDKVWSEEGGKQGRPKTSMLLFSINYTIDTEFDKNCYDLCYC